MKTFRFLFLTGIILLPSILAGQTNPIPNAGFENWTNGNPDFWVPLNFPGFAVPVTQSSTAHSGSSSVQGTVLTVSSALFPPYLQSMFSVSQSYGSLTGWYRYAPVGGDSLVISVLMYKQTGAIGIGTLETSVSVGAFSSFTVPISYFLPGPADSALIIISVTSSDDVHEGSTFLIDDLAFGTPVSVEPSTALPAVYALQQNYPNPFNPSTTISYDVPARSIVRLSVLNMLGQVVAVLADEEAGPGTFSATWGASAPSGVYFYRLDAQATDHPDQTFTQVRRMVLLK